MALLPPHCFYPDGQGRSCVQRGHEGSATYAKEISENLKELVFREVMPEIAGGFVAYRQRHLGIQQENDASLRPAHQALFAWPRHQALGARMVGLVDDLAQIQRKLYLALEHSR